MNLMALEISRFLMDNRKFPFKVQKYNLLIFVFTTFVLTILLGVIEKYITDGIKKLLFRKKDTEKQLAADKT